MDWLLQFSEQLPVLGLVALRSSGLFMTAPVFGQNRIPVMVRVFFSLSMAFMVFPFVSLESALVPQTTLPWLITGLLEILTGIIYGWSASLIFEGVILAGQFVGLQMGFAQANVLNPESQTQRPLLSEIYFVMAFLLFLSINGHHLLVMAFQHSFESVPLGHFFFDQQVLQRLLTLFAQIFIVALIIAAPINGILTLIDLIMGLIARTAPQMNVLIISFSIKIYIGILTLVISIAFTSQFLRDILPRLMEQVLLVL